MSKKKFDVMEKERHNFIYGSDECDGAIKRGVDEKTANEIFDQMLSFASYAFNKSHAAAYAFVSYKTAYLKCHYKTEFMAALMTSVLENTDKLISYIAACKEEGINVLPPDINKSELGFTVTGNSIRFGLLALKNLGKGVINKIIEDRQQNGDFESLGDFCKRLHGKEINKKAMESLIKCGAFDSFNYNRHEMVEGFPKILDSIEAENNRTKFGQFNLFSMEAPAYSDAAIVLEKQEEYPLNVILKYEREIIGMFLSGHPLTPYISLISKNKLYTTKDLENPKNIVDGQSISILGIITSKKDKNTRSRKTMSTLTLEDTEGTVDVLVFPPVYDKFYKNIKAYKDDHEKSIVILSGKLDLKDEGKAKIICDSLLNVYDEYGDGSALTQCKKIYIRVPSENSDEYKGILHYLGNLPKGDSSIYVKFADTDVLVKLSDKYSVNYKYEIEYGISSLVGEKNVFIKNG